LSRASVLADGRKFQEDGMLDQITAGSFTETIDPVTLATVRTITTTHYTGSALVKFPTLTVSDRTAAGQQYTTADVVVKVPIGAPRIPVNDLIVVNASTSDLLLVGREFRVKAAPQSGQVTSHRYPVEELS
jgi:hypothetical protein